MIGLNNQVWVTSALSDQDVKKALVLCYSLRRAFTSRKIAVIASPKISPALREALIDGFDLVFHLDYDQNTASLKDEDFAKLYAMAILRSYEKCAYISPTLMVLKNCDDIFDMDLSRGFLLSGKGTDTSVFLFCPSIRNFKILMTGLKNSNKYNGSGIGSYLMTWMANQYSSKPAFLDGKYGVALTQGKMLIGLDDDLSMINFTHKNYPEENMEMKKDFEIRFGLFGKLIAIHWLKILEHDVKPLIDHPVTMKKSPNDMTSSMSSRFCKEPIAIVGMSCRYPGSNSLDEFWELLFQGQDGICTPPPFRWRRDQCCRQRPDFNKTNAGFLKVPVDEFDAKFFGISPKEAYFMDPQHRLLQEVVLEGLENACIDPHTLHGTSGSVFICSWTNDYKDILVNSGDDQFFRVYMGNSIGAAAARISFLLGMTGPSISTESGCSSAMVAVHMACTSLQLKETNVSLACGVNLLLHPFDKDVMPMVVSPEGHCKTFSDIADGFARAEGCGVLVLKRLSDAIRDKDNIWGLIRGSAVLQEGITKSMGTPTVHCESLVMKEALENAQVFPEEVSFVEAHGTGTIVGDPMEVAAIQQAYSTPNRKEPLIIGSVKTNVGHTESCSGITGIIKTVLAMHHETIPAHRNFVKLNPSIDLESIPAVIPLERKEWKRRQGKCRIAGVSSFGISGTEAHVIIEEAPIISNNTSIFEENFPRREFHIMKVSAKTDEALNILLERYKDYLTETGNEDSLADIAYSANVGRANFSNRATIIAKSKEDMVAHIQHQKYLKGSVEEQDNMGKICFLFTGQGSQYPGMASELYETSPVFRVHFDHCEKLLREMYNISIKDALWGNDSSFDISATIYSQTSIFCVEYALVKLWESWGLRPDYVLGHSLGEFAAAVCSGILSVEDAIKLVAERSQLVNELPRGKMLVIKADQKLVDSLMKRFAGKEKNKMLDYAALNSSEQTVVAGDTEVILEFSAFCKQANDLKCVILDASHAFHSKHMDPILDKYRQVAEKIKVEKLPLERKICGYISGVRGDLIDNLQDINPEYWVQHTREKLEFLKASKKAIEVGCRIFIEIGPQPVLSMLTMMNNDSINLLCLPSLKRKEDEWQTLLNTLGKLYIKGVPVHWQGLDMFLNRKKCRLPHYPFMGKKYWPDLMQLGGSDVIHPLVGSPIHNASSTKIFQSGLNLRSELEYIKDHSVGQLVVFPGAGYLEIVLAAGLAAIEGDIMKIIARGLNRPMKVENLIIEAPLALDESKIVQMQTVLEFNKTSGSGDWNDLSVKIFHCVETDKLGCSSSPWLRHAVATFSPIPSAEEQNVSSFKQDKFLKTLTSSESNEETILQAYEKLASVGLNFGPAFCSLDKLWKMDGESNNCILAKVKVELKGGSDEQSPQSYIIHPVILDAMLQAIMMLKLSNNLKKKLYVPIKIGKFVCLSSCSNANSSEIYIQAFEETTGSSRSSGHANTENCSAYLVDSSGKVIAIMSQVEFIETTVQAVESILKQQTSTMPDLWEEIWRPKLGPLQHPVDSKLMLEALPKSETFRGALHKKYNDCPEVEETFDRLGNLVYFNMLRAMYECGWKIPELNSVFNENDLFSELMIEKQFRKQFSYFLRVFQQEGILDRIDNTLEWKVIKEPPSLEEIHETLQSPIYNPSCRQIQTNFTIL